MNHALDSEIVEQASSAEQQRCIAIKAAFAGDADFIFAAIVGGWTLDECRAKHAGPVPIGPTVRVILDEMTAAQSDK